MEQSKFSILIPAHNEASRISLVVEESLRYSNSVFVVDDGSTDGTGDLAMSAGAEVLTNRKQRGLGFALRYGFRHLMKSGINLVLTLDGDGVHDPSYTPDLIRSHLDARADLTIGSRFSQPECIASVPSSKIAANLFATCLINKVLDSNLTDAASGMRVLSQRALQLGLKSYNFSFAFELISEALRKNLRIHEHPITVRYDADELFCTSTKELIDLLDFAILKSKSVPRWEECLVCLRKTFLDYKLSRVKIGDHNMVLHPLREHKAFVFQIQSSWHMLSKPDESETQWLEVI